ncbi:hypothetical protein CVT26_002854 [Gymnopilus dilepis]|uniref:Uncharacterized protein n=1 Tax=Gymnopilus dilepis TaxID=231916 RepID=A0A409Y316_9AGAR|nr:hypothetical protein CVT26_002854 [Gymnopilus dilepis]
MAELRLLVGLVVRWGGCGSTIELEEVHKKGAGCKLDACMKLAPVRTEHGERKVDTTPDKNLDPKIKDKFKDSHRHHRPSCGPPGNPPPYGSVRLATDIVDCVGKAMGMRRWLRSGAEALIGRFKAGSRRVWRWESANSKVDLSLHFLRGRYQQ